MDQQEPVLLPGGPGECDHAEISEASVVRHDGRWHMVYQCRPERDSSRRFALAVSDDLWTWEKVPGDGTPVFTPLPEWSGWTEKGRAGVQGPLDHPIRGPVPDVLREPEQVGRLVPRAGRVGGPGPLEDRGPLMVFQRIENSLQGRRGSRFPG